MTIMERRINPFGGGNKTVAAFNNFGQQVHSSSLGRSLTELICYRVSQINHCGYCLDMHAKTLRAAGETEQRIYLLSAWREAPFYTERERAALAFSEELTTLGRGVVSDETFGALKAHFSDTEILDLMMAVIAINGYNRINIALGAEVGTFQVATSA